MPSPPRFRQPPAKPARTREATPREASGPEAPTTPDRAAAPEAEDAQAPAAAAPPARAPFEFQAGGARPMHATAAVNSPPERTAQPITRRPDRSQQVHSSPIGLNTVGPGPREVPEGTPERPAPKVHDLIAHMFVHRGKAPAPKEKTP